LRACESASDYDCKQALVAAIPAVIVYNMFSRQISGYRALMGDASAEVMRLISRDLDQGSAAPQRKVTLSAAA
jgi:hypothetical protein